MYDCDYSVHILINDVKRVFVMVFTTDGLKGVVVLTSPSCSRRCVTKVHYVFQTGGPGSDFDVPLANKKVRYRTT